MGGEEDSRSTKNHRLNEFNDPQNLNSQPPLAIEEQLAKDHVYENGCEKRLKALKDGNKFTEATVTTPTNSDVNCKKRKNASKASKGQFKRRKSAGPGDDNSAISDSHKGSDEDFSTSEELASEAKGDEDDEMDEAEETEETVETRLEELAALIKINTEALSRSFKQEREATMALSSLKEKKKKAERRRKAFCSISTFLMLLSIRCLTLS